jgi:hypothetical protein
VAGNSKSSAGAEFSVSSSSSEFSGRGRVKSSWMAFRKLSSEPLRA